MSRQAPGKICFADRRKVKALGGALMSPLLLNLVFKLCSDAGWHSMNSQHYCIVGVRLTPVCAGAPLPLSGSSPASLRPPDRALAGVDLGASPLLSETQTEACVRGVRFLASIPAFISRKELGTALWTSWGPASLVGSDLSRAGQACSSVSCTRREKHCSASNAGRRSTSAGQGPKDGGSRA